MTRITLFNGRTIDVPDAPEAVAGQLQMGGYNGSGYNIRAEAVVVIEHAPTPRPFGFARALESDPC